VRILPFAAAAGFLLSGQTSDPPVFRSTTRLVQVNVVVHGKKNAPVADLKPEDFQVFEKGKPQKIAFFSVVRANKLTQPATKLPQNVFSNRFGDRKDVPQSVTVILLDTLNTSWADQGYARKQVLKFLSQIEPRDRVALYTLGRGLRILHDYTTDSTALVERLKKVSGETLPELEYSKGPNTRMDPMDELLPAEMLEVEQRFADFIAGTRTLNTLRALEVIAEHLAAVPGRKSLVWVSGGFPLSIGFDDFDDFVEEINARSRSKMVARDKQTYFDEVESTIRALNHANVAVYPVDARGLMVDPMFSATVAGTPRARTLPWSPPHLDTMDVLADRTGGKAYYNRNDIDRAVREVFEDGEVTYTLGYYPSEPKLDGSFRDIKVKVTRPGIEVRHRKGYFSFQDLKAEDERAVKADLKNAVWSPLDATAVALNARVDLDRDKNVYRIAAQVAPGTVTLQQNADRWTGRIHFVFVQKGQDGRQLQAGVAHTLDLNLTKETYTTALMRGLIFIKILPVIPGATSLRIVARDAPSGLAGSVTVPLGKVVALSTAAPASK
jgi:VWFA-related protein